MGRTFAAVSTLLALIALAGVWAALHPPLTPFLVPEATDIRVVRVGLNEWRISYEAPSALWPAVVERNLAAVGWESPDQVGYGALSRNYERALPREFFVLWEWAYLRVSPAQPRAAYIIVRRRITCPLWCVTGRLMAD